ncbi:MAG: zinc ribbon domain-containing protein [Verrucomicrobiales bacterium]|nr:zinc ribbon domain-containing protein [Verrucomicrobiales bacterium]
MKRNYHSRNDGELINRGHGSQRFGLRVLGIVLVLTGLGFILTGAVDFFGSIGKLSGFPNKFWCIFVGMPLLAIGIGCLRAGFAGKITRYYSGEVAPVAKDTANYVIDGTRETLVSTVREAIGKGAEVEVECPSCNARNDLDSKFCKECGSAIPGPKRCNCGTVNDADAKFCDECGTPLTEAG